MNEVSDLVSRWHVGRIHPTPDVEPEGWTLEKLCDIARLESGHTPSRNRPDYWDGNIPWLSLHDSKTIEGKTLYNTKMTVSALGLANSSARLLPSGTVALSRTATIGKVAVLGREMATSQDFACYICGPRLSNAYLAHLFRGMEVEWDRLMAGSTHNTIYMPIFENMQILVPPMAEQEAIAEALSDADALIEGLERLIDKKRLIKQGAMQDLLTAKRRLPGFSGEWVEYTIGELERSGRLRLGRGRVISKVDITNHPGAYPIYSSSALNNGMFGTFGQFDFDEELITWSIDGGGHVFHRPKHKFSVTNVCGFLRIQDETLDYKFLTEAMKQARSTMKFDYQDKAHPSVVRGAYSFQLPGRDEQKAIAQIATDMDLEIQVLESRLEKARQVKEGMMQTLLTGRIRLV